MKLISKFKDYYDYLVHRYGVDNNIVYNRQASKLNIFEYSSKSTYFIKLWICGYVYFGIYERGKFYYGDELFSFGERLRNSNSYVSASIRNRNPEIDIDSVVRIDTESNARYKKRMYLSIIPYKDRNEINKHFKSPICAYTGYDFFPDITVERKLETSFKIITNPNLSEFSFAKVLKPEEIYLKIIDWLTPRDEVVDSRTNKEKILTNGFDLKTSFRNVK